MADMPQQALPQQSRIATRKLPSDPTNPYDQEDSYKRMLRKDLLSLAKSRSLTIVGAWSRATKTILTEALLANDGIISRAVAKTIEEAKAAELATRIRNFRFDRFLNLPPELRVLIYEAYFLAVENDREIKNIDKKRNSPQAPALLQVCKFIRAEATPYFYGSGLYYIKIKSWPRVLLTSQPGLPCYHGLTEHTMDFFTTINPSNLALINHWKVLVSWQKHVGSTPERLSVWLNLRADREGWEIKVAAKGAGRGDPSSNALCKRVGDCLRPFMTLVAGRDKTAKWLPGDARIICKKIRQVLGVPA